MIYVETILKILNSRNGGKTTKCSMGIAVKLNRASFYVYGMKIVPAHCMDSYGKYGDKGPHFLNFGSR
jgi:hypothetical protein